MRNAANAALHLTAHDLHDYAQWDQAVINLVRSYDQIWADDNLGPYLGVTQGYDHVFVVNAADRALYEFHKDHNRTGFAPEQLLGSAVAHSLAALRELPKSESPLITGFSRSDGIVYIFAAAAIVPLTNKVTIGPGKPHVILIAKKVDEQYLTQLAREHHLPSLRLNAEIGKDEQEYLALRAPDGPTMATLSWAPKRPGAALRREILPAFLIVGFLSLTAAGVILRRASRAIDALRLSESRARHLAMHDILTGLPNRRTMNEKLQEGVDVKSTLALMYMDLDGFKETNDVYGHGAGDELLRLVASRLTEIIPPNHLVARMGGDEFAVLMASPADEAHTLSKAILASFGNAFAVAGYRVPLGVSIGIATTEWAQSAEEMVRQADFAMYAAKANGKHGVCVYSPEMDAGRDLRKLLQQELRVAIDSHEIGVVFQPIVSAADYRIVAVEALARWSHSEHGDIGPGTFIPIAEESGLIAALGLEVLSIACRQAREWNVNLAVNLSPAQFWDRGLAETIQTVLARTGFPAERLELEVTESYLFRSPEAGSRILAELKAMGVRIALDDFGTGFASIGYLQQLAFDSIKIDQSFVAAAASSSSAADLVRAIVGIGDALDLPITAEGVERQEQAALMRSAGCTRLQGWLFGRPMSAAEMTGCLAETSFDLPSI